MGQCLLEQKQPMNKLILEMEMMVDSSNKEEASSFLFNQTETIVRIIRDVLSSYKEKGIIVPVLSMRGSAKKEPLENDGMDKKKFRDALLDHLLKFQPKVAIPSQVKVINELYSLDKPTEEWINLFEESRKEYNLTTWHTVKYRLNKVKEEKEPELKELNSKEIEDIKSRLKSYSKPVDM